MDALLPASERPIGNAAWHLLRQAEAALEKMDLSCIAVLKAERFRYEDLEIIGSNLRRQLILRLETFQHHLLDRVQGHSFLPAPLLLRLMAPFFPVLIRNARPHAAIAAALKVLLEGFGLVAEAEISGEGTGRITLRVTLPGSETGMREKADVFEFWLAEALRRFPGIFGYRCFRPPEVQARLSAGSTVLRIGLEWGSGIVSPANPLAALIDGLECRGPAGNASVAGNNRGPRKVLRIRFNHAAQSLYVDDAWLMRDKPARILRKVIREYRESGRTRFTHAEFRRDREIFPDPGCAYFETRLNRVMERVRARNPGMALAWAGKGRFHLEIKGEFAYEED